RHRLNALTSARTDQPRHVEWTHLSPRLVTQPIQKRLEKASKLFFPTRRPFNHGRLLQSRPPMSHRKTDLGIPCRSKSAKVVLARAAYSSSCAGSVSCSCSSANRSHSSAIFSSAERSSPGGRLRAMKIALTRKFPILFRATRHNRGPSNRR